MCSIVDGSLDQGALSEKKIPIDVANSICKKCREAKSVLCLRVKDTYCKECFLTSSTHKFRSTLGKHKVMRPGDQVLIGFSGNQGSLALLHLNSAGLDEANQKRLLFESKILIIDETGPFLDDPNARLEHTRSLSQLASKFSFPVHITSLEYVLLNGETDVHPMKIFKAPEEEYELPPKSLTEELKNLFNKTKEASAKEALIHNLKRKLLVDLAPVLGCKKIFTAECSTSLAVTLMSGIF